MAQLNDDRPTKESKRLSMSSFSDLITSSSSSSQIDFLGGNSQVSTGRPNPDEKKQKKRVHTKKGSNHSLVSTSPKTNRRDKANRLSQNLERTVNLNMGGGSVCSLPIIEQHLEKQTIDHPTGVPMGLGFSFPPQSPADHSFAVDSDERFVGNTEKQTINHPAGVPMGFGYTPGQLVAEEGKERKLDKQSEKEKSKGTARDRDLGTQESQKRIERKELSTEKEMDDGTKVDRPPKKDENKYATKMARRQHQRKHVIKELSDLKKEYQLLDAKNKELTNEIKKLRKYKQFLEKTTGHSVAYMMDRQQEQKLQAACACVAAGFGNIEALKLMLEKGAEIHLGTLCDNRTPLHLAAAQGSYQCVRFLIENGSDIKCKDRQGITPFDEAFNAKHAAAAFELDQAKFQQYLSTKPTERLATDPVAELYSPEIIAALPDSFDWRPKGAVTDVKDQGQCGSCWAFSATGNIEGQWFLSGKKLVSLSEQNLVDCDHECLDANDCDSGCEGGLQPNAYNYVIKNNGIDTEDSYAYEAVDGSCRFKAASVGARISNWTFIAEDEQQMAAYLVDHGPVAVAVDAEIWQFYVGSGVVTLPCGTTLDHGVLIVGYGVETDIFGSKVPYWTIKNSWGADWGDSGYIYIQRGTGECGVDLYATSSII